MLSLLAGFVAALREMGATKVNVSVFGCGLYVEFFDVASKNGDSKQAIGFMMEASDDGDGEDE